MIIYVVTDGSYSDYRIKGVFSTEENAQKFIKHVGGEIEEWELDRYVSDNRYPFNVTSDGNETYILPFHTEDNINKVRNIKYADNRNYTVDVLAEDREHAIKIASDLIAEYKACAT